MRSSFSHRKKKPTRFDLPLYLDEKDKGSPFHLKNRLFFRLVLLVAAAICLFLLSLSWTSSKGVLELPQGSQLSTRFKRHSHETEVEEEPLQWDTSLDYIASPRGSEDETKLISQFVKEGVTGPFQLLSQACPLINMLHLLLLLH